MKASNKKGGMAGEYELQQGIIIKRGEVEKRFFTNKLTVDMLQREFELPPLSTTTSLWLVGGTSTIFPLPNGEIQIPNCESNNNNHRQSVLSPSSSLCFELQCSTSMIEAKQQKQPNISLQSSTLTTHTPSHQSVISNLLAHSLIWQLEKLRTSIRSIPIFIIANYVT